MIRLVLRGLATRKLRSVLTAVSILLGVAMISGTFVLTDQIQGAFDDIFLKANAGTDVVVSRATAFDTFGQPAGPLPASLLGPISRVDGVAAAGGQVAASGSLVVDGEFVTSRGGPPLVISQLGGPFNTNQLLSGSFPRRSGEIAVDEGLASREHLAVGRRVQLATRAGLRPVRIVGVFRFAASSIGGATIVLTTLDDAQRWFDRRGEFSLIRVAAVPGVSASALAARVRAVVPADVKVETGVQNAEDQSSGAAQLTSFLRIALLVFAFVAVAVGAFVIFNTFSITVAQRTRELAMLRTVGASRRQVLRMVLGEALVVGVVASLVGLAAGLGFARLLNRIFEALDFGLPTAAPHLAGRTVAWALAVGILVTLVAAFIPAQRATRVPPIAALREGATLPRGRFALVRRALAGLLGLVGIILLVVGLFGSLQPGPRAFAMGAGALLVFIGVGDLARYAVPHLARAIGWPLERALGGPARLARENAVRNPARTASTSAALMIGVGLMAFVTIFLQGLQDSFTGALGQIVRGELIIQGRNFQPIPAGAVPVVRATPGVAVAAPVEFAPVKINDGGTDTMNGIDPRSGAAAFAFDWRRGGSDALLAGLAPGQALVESDFASSHDLALGDRFRVTSVDRRSLSLRVAGVYEDPQLFTGFVVSERDFARIEPDSEPGVIVVSTAPGSDPAAVQQVLSGRLDQSFPIADVKTKAQYVDEVEGRVSDFRNLLYGLLALPVVISLFGIVNTLVLAVYERTREIGMIRAIGMTRAQLRQMIRIEGIITAVIGGVLGVAVGILFGWLMVRALEDQGLVFSVPVVQMVLLLVLALIAGLVAASLPARHAARLNVLEALHYE